MDYLHRIAVGLVFTPTMDCLESGNPDIQEDSKIYSYSGIVSNELTLGFLFCAVLVDVPVVVASIR